MKKLSGVAVVTTAEGERVSYTYMELDGNGNITSQNNRGSFVALDEEVLAWRKHGLRSNVTKRAARAIGPFPEQKDSCTASADLKRVMKQV